MEESSWIRAHQDGVLLMIQAVVRSAKTQIVDITEQRCRIKVKAPPVDGAANKALINFMAKTFGLSKSSVKLVSGEKSRQKTFFLENIDLVKALETVKIAIETGGERQ